MTSKLMTLGFLIFTLLYFGCGSGGGATGDTDQESVDQIEVQPETDTDDTPVEQEQEQEGSQYPDPSFVHEIRTRGNALEDTLYFQEFAEQYHTVDQLPNLDVRAMAFLAGKIYVGTAQGLFAKTAQEETFSEVTMEGGAGAVVDIAREVCACGVLGVALADRVELIALEDGQGETVPFDTAAITSIALTDDYVAIGTAQGVYLREEQVDFSPLVSMDGIDVRDLAFTAAGDLIAATATGLYVIDVEQDTADNLVAADGDLVDDDARAVAVCDSKIVVATATGLAIHDGAGVTLRPAGMDGLPTDGLIALDCNEDGILIGHEIGATWLASDLSHTDYYQSGRWMPHNRAPGVALSGMDRWVGGQAGASRIHLVERTLAQKADFFDSAYVEHFWRMGGFFSSDASTPNGPWDPIDTVKLYDKDNDGLWTQMMVGGWCFAYAATGERKYYDYARKAMDNMFKLVDYPEATFSEKGFARGFISRSIVSEDEPHLYQPKLDAGELVSITDTERKDILRWNPVTIDGKNYLWKADTSSDELAGHWFGFPVFYDLCAQDDEERAEIAGYADAIARYIVEGGYLLIDHDGTRTMHGHWNPESISICLDGYGECEDNGYEMEECLDACLSGMHGGGWLNGLEILGGLLATYHMTGDTYFYDAYEELISVYRYDEIVMPNDGTFTITKPAMANHSDHELAMLAYTTLIRYEPNEDRRARWIDSLEFLYEWELGERNPWWAGVCAISGCVDPATDVDSAVRTLREMPDDNRKWRIDHSHRKDMEIVGNDRHGDPQIDIVYPYDEIRTMWWNGNPYEMASGGDGRSRYCPTNFLLPYWMNVYAGVIVPAR